jgi:hypothetical protein
MRLRYRFASFLAVLALVSFATGALAAKPAVETAPYVGGTPIQIDLSARPVTNLVCELGVLDPPAFIVNYLLPPDDAYYTLIRPSDCTACTGPGGVEVLNINVLLNFPVACTQPVAISVVRAGGDPACRTPIPTDVLCGPIGYNLAPGAAGNFQFTMPLLAGCCITDDAFIVVNFTAAGAGCATSATRPRLITSNVCNACVSYNIYPGGGPDDLCTDIGFPGNPNMWAEVDCCNVVPTDRQSWGRMKMLYR